MLTKPNPASTTLYSSPQELESHVIRFIMAEKSIEREVVNLKDNEEMPEEIPENAPPVIAELKQQILKGSYIQLSF